MKRQSYSMSMKQSWRSRESMKSNQNDLNTIEVFDHINGLKCAVDHTNAKQIWSFTRGAGIKIATIDTGIDQSHPDLSYKNGIDMINRTNLIQDEDGHGTHVAGIIAGKRTGIAPEAELYIAKVLNSDRSGTVTNVMDGITFALNHQVDILCLSLGTNKQLPQILEERIVEAYNKGMIIVSAAGNFGNKIVFNPARMNEVIGVGGLLEDGSRATYSNYGRGVDVYAPSHKIVSTHLNGKYASMTGTSMASPIIAGQIALLLAYFREKGVKINNNDIYNIIRSCGGALDIRKIIKP